MNIKDPQRSRPNDQPLIKDTLLDYMETQRRNSVCERRVELEPQTKMKTNLPCRIPQRLKPQKHQLPRRVKGENWGVK